MANSFSAIKIFCSATTLKTHSPHYDSLCVERCVSIRHPKASDATAFLQAVQESRSLHGRWSQPPNTPAKFKAYLERYALEMHRSFLVINRKDRQLAGVININNIIRGHFHSASLGYYAFAGHEGRGRMRTALQLVLLYVFDRLRLHRLEANIQPGNIASIALAKGAGFVYEGYSKRFLKIAGRWRDHERWALLREDFRARKIPLKIT
ncbi:MAG TPA: GNAT family protein [Verrucomicrobiae bacterium]